MNERQAVATFSWDDGHPLDLRIAEIFNTYGLSCTFYVPRHNSENLPTLSFSGLRSLSQSNFDIHSHTLNHVYLSGLPVNKQAIEIQSGKKYVEDVTGKKNHIFCYPGGKHTQKTIALVKEAGFEFARTIDMGFTYAYSQNNFLMPTTALIAPLTCFQILKHSLKRLGIRRGLDAYKLNRAILSKTLSHGDMSKTSEIVCYHFWGHSWEIEKHNLWEHLEHLIQSLIASNINIISNKVFYETLSYEPRLRNS